VSVIGDDSGPGAAGPAQDASVTAGVPGDEAAGRADDAVQPADAQDLAPGCDDDRDDAEPAEPPTPALVADEDVPAALEAVLLVVDSPVTESALAAAVGRSAAQVREQLTAIAERLTTSRSGMDLREAGDGWRLYTRPEFAPVVERFVLDGAQARLSKAALESLAVIAYRQPVTRARVAAVRGVNVDGVIRTLLSRGLIEEAGMDPDTGGILYRTTELFLERMGLTGIDDLPSLGPLLPDVDAIDDV